MGKLKIEDSIVENGFHLATVSGDSMMPMLRQNIDMVKIVPVTGILNKYDLPLYRRPTGEYVLHRIVSVKKGYYITCGDNRFNREKVPYEWVIGVMESMFRGEKEISANDSEYLKYAEKICKTYWSRRIKNKIKKVLAI